jgi:hypothetical protein
VFSERDRRRQVELTNLHARVRSGYEKYAPQVNEWTPEQPGDPGWTPTLDGPDPPTNGPAQPVGNLDEWDAGDDPGPIPPREWLLANQFCRGFISSIVAAGGGGKTALRLVQFISLAIGRSLCGQHVFQRCRVLIVSLEDDRDELQRRITAVLEHYSIEQAQARHHQP